MTASPLLYNQSTLSDDDFVANFVARGDLLETLLRRLRTIDPDVAGNHQILIGTRGMGKSSLLRRLAIAINRDESLEQLYIPLTFREEQYNVLTLGDFWRNCGEALAEWAEAKGLHELAERLDAALATKAWAGNDTSAERLNEELTQLQRRAVLLVDNLDLILTSLSCEDQWALRRYLQARQGPIMIGAAPQPLAQSAEREAAFYEFFQPHHLDPLNQQETEKCMRALAQRRGEHGTPVTRVLNSQPERLKTLHALTGGNPRVLTLIYRLLEASETNGAMADLERLLDQVTPYYKARIEEYQTPQQRAVIDAIALHWDPITIGMLSQITSIPATTLSSLLLKLRRDGLIESTEVSSSSAGHQITERFLNIWYLMRHGTRRTKYKLRWLVRFLTAFYSTEDLGIISEKISTPDFMSNCHSDYKLAISEALTQIEPKADLHFSRSINGDCTSNEHTQLIAHDETQGMDANHSSNLAASAQASYKQALDLGRQGNLPEAVEIFNHIINHFSDTTELALRKQVARALFNKGITLGWMDDFVGAISAYNDLITRFADAAEPEFLLLVAKAMFEKGDALREKGDISGAIATFDNLVSKFGDAPEPLFREPVARALFEKGISLGKIDNLAEAILAYDSLIDRFENTTEQNLRLGVLLARINKGVILQQMGDLTGALSAFESIDNHDEAVLEPEFLTALAQAEVYKGVTLGKMGNLAAAITSFDSVATRFDTPHQHALQKEVLRALINKGVTLGEMNNLPGAIDIYDSIITRFYDTTEPAVQRGLARTFINKGITLQKMGDLTGAIDAYDSVIVHFGDNPEEALQEEVARALFNKGATLGLAGDLAGEISTYNSIEARFGDKFLREISETLINRGILLEENGDFNSAITAYDAAITRHDHSTTPIHPDLIIQALNNKANIFGKIGDFDAAITAYDSIVARFGTFTESPIIDWVVIACLNKGVTLNLMGEPARAITVFDSIESLIGEATTRGLQELMAQTLVMKGNTLGLRGDLTAAIIVYDRVIAQFGDFLELSVVKLVAQAQINKGSALNEIGDSAGAISVYDSALTQFGNSNESEVQKLVAKVQILLGSKLLELHGDLSRSEALFQAATTIEPLAAKANLTWVYLLDNKTSKARELWSELDKLPQKGRTILKAALAVNEDNFGIAVDALSSVLAEELDEGDWIFEDDLNHLIRLIERRGYGERLITWFEESGFAEQVAPIYVALKAYIQGEPVLRDVNPEVRSAAQKIYNQLDAPRRYQRKIETGPTKTQRRRGRPRKT